MSKTAGARSAQPKEKRASLTDSAPPNTKTCRKCQHTMPVEFMVKSKGKPSCIWRKCEAARKRAEWAADPEGSRAKNREKRRRNPRNVERERTRARERARTPKGREINRRAVRRYQQRHPERVAAQQEVRSAVRRGEIKVPTVCQVLGCKFKDGLHLHHPRYDRPRDVIATCRHHHEDLHHRGPLELKPGAGRKWARAPRHEHGHAVNSSR
jgi:hypothetical protein